MIGQETPHKTLSDWYEDVRQFHLKFGLPVGDKPGWPPKTSELLRGSLIGEEMKEYVNAVVDRNFPEMVDGILDLIYVLLGHLVEAGVDPHPIWAAIQAANMAKDGGSKRADGKILKPEGWTPPAVEQLLIDQGYEPAKGAESND